MDETLLKKLSPRTETIAIIKAAARILTMGKSATTAFN